jgi:hypothetical protein
MTWLYGKTGYSFLDYWTLGHFCLWFWIGTITGGLKWNRVLVFCASMALAYAFEWFEWNGEHRWFPALATHPESWWNRCISDPLMVVLGLLIAWYGFDHWRSP